MRPLVSVLHARFNSAAAAFLSPALILKPFFLNFSVPAPSKLAIPAAASFQISLSNLAAVGSPLYDPPPPLLLLLFLYAVSLYSSFNAKSFAATLASSAMRHIPLNHRWVCGSWMAGGSHATKLRQIQARSRLQ